MKGVGHTYDGTGGTGELQVNVTVENRSSFSQEIGRFDVFIAETA
jgi:hypothetical protein